MEPYIFLPPIKVENSTENEYKERKNVEINSFFFLGKISKERYFHPLNLIFRGTSGIIHSICIEERKLRQIKSKNIVVQLIPGRTNTPPLGSTEVLPHTPGYYHSFPARKKHKHCPIYIGSSCFKIH